MVTFCTYQTFRFSLDLVVLFLTLQNEYKVIWYTKASAKKIKWFENSDIFISIWYCLKFGWSSIPQKIILNDQLFNLLFSSLWSVMTCSCLILRRLWNLLKGFWLPLMILWGQTSCCCHQTEQCSSHGMKTNTNKYHQRNWQLGSVRPIFFFILISTK